MTALTKRPDLLRTSAVDADGMLDARCPCCSAPISPDRLLIDRTTNSVTRNGITIRLSPMMISIIAVLAAAAPAAVTHDVFATRAAGFNGQPPSLNALRVHVCALRKMVACLGVSVEATWGLGYRIAFDVTEEPSKRRGANRLWQPDELKSLERLVFVRHVPILNAAIALGRPPRGTAVKVEQIALRRKAERRPDASAA